MLSNAFLVIWFEGVHLRCSSTRQSGSRRPLCTGNNTTQNHRFYENFMLVRYNISFSLSQNDGNEGKKASACSGCRNRKPWVGAKLKNNLSKLPFRTALNDSTVLLFFESRSKWRKQTNFVRKEGVLVWHCLHVTSILIAHPPIAIFISPSPLISTFQMNFIEVKLSGQISHLRFSQLNDYRIIFVFSEENEYLTLLRNNKNGY